MICFIWIHDHLRKMENDKYVTVIPIEYPRPSRLYSHAPYHYNEYPKKVAPDNVSVQNTNFIEHQHSGIKQSEFVLNHTDCNEFHNNFRTNSNNKLLHVCVYLMNNVVLHMELENGRDTTVAELIQCIVELDALDLPENAKSVFTLWMNSGLLELQLKPHHKPLLIRSKWTTLLSRFAHASLSRQLRDEPILSFQRNVFYPLIEEEKLLDLKTLEILYEEAKYNVLEGRYPCDVSQYIMLGGVQARLELGPFNPQLHTNKFFRNQKNKFLPVHIRHSPLTSWFRSRIKNSPEVRILEHYKRIPSSATDRKLQRRYLEVCWSFPYYGCAFFQAQIEEPVRGLTSLLLHQDMPVLVGINERGLYIIDNIEAKLLVGLKYEDFSWELGKPQKSNCDSLSCIFIQFAVIENGTRVSKLMQIFSKQSDMMDALINTFVTQIKENFRFDSPDEIDNPRQSELGKSLGEPQSKLPNKLSKLSLATFDDEGRCIGHMGSLKFSS